MSQIPPAYPQNVNMNVDAAGNVTAELPCRKCGYNLRGLPAAGRCPECGAAVGLSIHGDLLRFSSPDWLRTLRSGVRLIIASVVFLFLGMIAVMVGGAAVPSFRANIQFVASVVGLAGSVLGFFGGWRLTEPDPSGIGEDRYGTSRKIIRVALAVGIGNTFLQFIENLASVPPSARIALSVVGGLAGLIGLVGQFAQLNYLGKLALRIPDAALAKRARFLMWAIGISYGFILVMGIVFAVVAWANSGAGAAPPPGAAMAALACPMGLALLTLIVFGIMYLLMLEKFGKRFGDEASAAEATWASIEAPQPVPPTLQS